MSGGAAAGAAAAAAAGAAVARAIKASGTIVELEPREFRRVLALTREPLVVHAVGGVFSRTHRYLVSHRGLCFFTKSGDRLDLPTGAELVEAGKIWVPG